MDNDNMDLINNQFRSIGDQFKQVNAKLDKLGELMQQTNLQEYRIQQLEDKLQELTDKNSSTFWRVMTPVLSAFTAGVVSYIISGGLSK